MPAKGIPVASLPGGDRPKGSSSSGPELSIYLKSASGIELANQAVLGEGNTVQLAYTAPAGTEASGVVNYAGGLQGVQGGIVNIIRKDQEDTKGVQLGIVNISGSENVFPIGLVNLRLVGGYKFFKHLGIFGGVSYDYFYMYQANSPDPRNFNGLMLGGAIGPNIHKFGFFGGIQF